MQGSARRPEPQSGFTLLEVLIGLVLLSIMMSLLFGSIRMGAKVWDAGETRAAELDRMLVVQNFLRQRLTTALPLIDDFSTDEAEFSFSGTRDSIQFVSNLPSSARRGGLYQFRLELVDDGDSGVLVAKLKAFYPTLPGVEGTIEDVRLISGVDRVEWSYFGKDEFDFESSEGRWMDDWKDKDFMPSLVRMELQMKDGRVWPPLIVSPKLVSGNQGFPASPASRLE